MDWLVIWPRKDTGRTQWSICLGAVPASPCRIGWGITIPISMDHDKPTNRVLVCHIIQATLKLLRASVPKPPVEVQDQRGFDVIVDGVLVFLLDEDLNVA